MRSVRISTFGWKYGSNSPASSPAMISFTEKDSAGSGWLVAPIGHRNIGALAMGPAFFPSELPACYDILIFFDHTTASVLLPPHRRD